MPPLIDTVQIVVNVADENDEAPVFSIESFHFSLIEDQDYINFVRFHVSIRIAIAKSILVSLKLTLAILKREIFKLHLHLAICFETN